MLATISFVDPFLSNLSKIMHLLTDRVVEGTLSNHLYVYVMGMIKGI